MSLSDQSFERIWASISAMHLTAPRSCTTRSASVHRFFARSAPISVHSPFTCCGFEWLSDSYQCTVPLYNKDEIWRGSVEIRWTILDLKIHLWAVSSAVVCRLHLNCHPHAADYKVPTSRYMIGHFYDSVHHQVFWRYWRNNDVHRISRCSINRLRQRVTKCCKE